MNRFISACGAALVAIVMTASTSGAAVAAPAMTHQTQISSDVQLAQYHEKRRPNARNHRDRREMNTRRDRRGYWHGHRGYREHRKGYRRHSDGYYYAPSVFKLYIR